METPYKVILDYTAVVFLLAKKYNLKYVYKRINISMVELVGYYMLYKKLCFTAPKEFPHKYHWQRKCALAIMDLSHQISGFKGQFSVWDHSEHWPESIELECLMSSCSCLWIWNICETYKDISQYISMLKFLVFYKRSDVWGGSVDFLCETRYFHHSMWNTDLQKFSWAKLDP